MMSDNRTTGQALAGLFDTDMLMSDEFSRKKKEQALLQAPTSLVDQMDERHGKLKSRLGLFGHLLGGGTVDDFGDADLVSQYTADKAAFDNQQKIQGFQQMMPFINEQIGFIQDDDPTNNAAAMFALGQAGVDNSLMERMFPGMAPSEDTDIMRTTKAYVESYNEDNPDNPISFHEGYDIVKNYDAGRKGDQASAVAAAQSDVQQYTSSRDAYITAVEQDAVLADRISNIDKGLALLESGEVDTGPVVGFLAETFGMGSQDLAALQQMSLEEAMEALQAFKGPTTDFEFGKAELKSFAQIFKGEDLNIGTLKSARNSLEKIRKRNMLSGQSHLEAVKQYGSEDQYNRLQGVFAQPEYWSGPRENTQSSTPQTVGSSVTPDFSQFEKDARARGVTDPVIISAKYKELYGG
jgi:hypothetical protein